MQAFSTKEVRHDFSIDGVAYYLSGVTVDDLEKVAELSAMATEPQLLAFRELLASRAECPRRWFWQKSPRRAVGALNIKQLSELFKAWTGMGKTVGESSALDA